MIKKKVILALSSVVFLYVIIKAFQIGHDINVYLYASKQLFNGENIYTSNPYNNYLYSPFFALLLRPFSLFDFSIARVLWAIVNFCVAIRLGKLLIDLIVHDLVLPPKILNKWTIGLFIISIGFLNHNLILGQITIVILWLLIEGLYQIILKNKWLFGSLLLAVGIVIKIIPIISLFYLFLKGRFKAMVFVGVFSAVCLLLPSVFVGHDYNMEQIENWVDTINPTNSKYVFENNDGNQSFNAILPAYFFDFDDDKRKPFQLKRTIYPLQEQTLLYIMQVLRLALLILFAWMIYQSYQINRNKYLYFYKEISFLCLISILFFPHQMKYALLYFVPAGSLILLEAILILKSNRHFQQKHKIAAYFSLILLILSSIMGKDIVGRQIAKVFDYYHGFGLVVIISIGLLHRINVDKFNSLSTS